MSIATASLRALLVSATLTVACAAVAHDGRGNSHGRPQAYRSEVLVSNGAVAANTDPNLVNGWGIAFNPTGVVWVNDEQTGKSTLYDGNGVPQTLVVTVPGTALGTPGHPTGIVFSGGADFLVTKRGATPAEDRTGPARFIFATLEGTISGWAPSVDLTNAIPAVANSSAAAVYTGLAVSGDGATHLLYAANFSEGRVDVFDGTFKSVSVPGGFVDRHLPRHYAPFGVQAINGDVYVTYARQGAAIGQPALGAGQGFVNVFDPEGRLVRRLVSRGALNAPWGLALAPASFGRFGGALLVANFGSGTIDAYGPRSGKLLGSLRDLRGRRLHIDGLRGLGFGNGVQAQSTNELFYTAGPNHGQEGEYGVITAVTE